jgi:hypothetical protein
MRSKRLQIKNILKENINEIREGIFSKKIHMKLQLK